MINDTFGGFHGTPFYGFNHQFQNNFGQPFQYGWNQFDNGYHFGGNTPWMGYNYNFNNGFTNGFNNNFGSWYNRQTPYNYFNTFNNTIPFANFIPNNFGAYNQIPFNYNSFNTPFGFTPFYNR